MKRFASPQRLIPWALALCVLAAPAAAQTPRATRPAQAPQQAAATQDIDPNTLANAAVQVLAGFDRDQAGALWDGASAVTKRTVKREEFVGHLAKTRKPLGAPVERSWLAVRRQQVTGGTQLPPGLYASIEFATRFQNNRTARELVSLRLDEDRVWRFAGYVIE
ncbi:DUF4019 domain-containing protein [Vulcaniibacterium tengchongense]|uniref:Uncharacterized protein DUF4019 n=1 Tax=Vulcaniibacterium tengchongense TaxID=1273429 RepID=A0A3N4VAL9_9GAMM|nr:DUF4019 domain-containing protein [Vulcaniibacterium tengchongense]RPE80032.1 uncharacterized protein DUF4019 [Vulcaniibacterium tengchongense]